ncbi:U7 snRNA-associated Sm-like protein LSm11 [Corythoichthys intestinalis]|uniref:U7 snRNA-associated Sm-like protein LSm11 n=1 Tax=Corythoichthys intestinalis TaxID=161448 RepID=UPI0025A4FE74|nr:U7 snRNA-associated Sm-like protein LSm11 [Corythoichthys intestinalis]XP_061792645.1 U7 snRNA-associated Sm-like protein LSm11 [Nerophis lumbriciformis]
MCITSLRLFQTNMEEKERDKKPDNSDRNKNPDKNKKGSTSSSSVSAVSQDDEASKLDVCSEKFDPRLALYAPVVPLPFPNIKCFNNVAEYEGFIKGGRGRAKPENVEKKRREAMKGVADPERIERLKKLMVNKKLADEGDEGGSSNPTPQRRRHKPIKNVLTRMTVCQGSPLGELHRCVEQRIRVKVHIRTFKGLRGVCSGFVVAFDKFWNLAMVDVDETYREPLLGKALYHEKALTISRLFEKLKLQDNSCSEGAATKHHVQGERSQHPLLNPKDSSKHSSAHFAKWRGNDEISETPKDPKASQEKECKVYGKVRTRHINQLFIRGENVLLINPESL